MSAILNDTILYLVGLQAAGLIRTLEGKALTVAVSAA
jgi:hypothetical protein